MCCDLKIVYLSLNYFLEMCPVHIWMWGLHQRFSECILRNSFYYSFVWFFLIFAFTCIFKRVSIIIYKRRALLNKICMVCLLIFGKGVIYCKVVFLVTCVWKKMVIYCRLVSCKLVTFGIQIKNYRHKPRFWVHSVPKRWCKKFMWITRGLPTMI